MRRSTVLLALLGVLAITAGWWVFIIGPRNEAITNAEDRLIAAEGQGQQLRIRIQQLNDIKDQEISYLFAIGEMQSSIPQDPEFDTFLEDLTFLAERSGVDVIAISATPPVATIAEGVQLFEIELNLALEGQFFEILGFLFGLEEQERLIRVDTVAINPIIIPEDEDTTTTTSTAAPDGSSTSSTSSTSTTTTTTTLDVRARPEPGLLSLTITARLFTRTPVIAPTITLPGGEEPPPDSGDGS
jgi:Tfp pilus assembly protein PilO